MVHPDDLKALKVLTRHCGLPEGFEREYAQWLRMYHTAKGQGALGALMVPLLRSLGVTLPDVQRTEDRVDWRKIKAGTRVQIRTDARELTGTFSNVSAYEQLGVFVDGDPYKRVFARSLVTLLPTPEPEFVYEEPELARQPEPLEEVPYSNETPELPDHQAVQAEAEQNADSPETAPAPPKMRSDHWMNVNRGARVLVEHDNDIADAAFVSLGPGDGEVTLWVDGAEDATVVKEEAVTVA